MVRIPSSTSVSQVPQIPSVHEQGTSMPAAWTASRIDLPGSDHERQHRLVEHVLERRVIVRVGGAGK